MKFVFRVISPHFPGCSCIISKKKRGKILTYIVMTVWDMEFLFSFFQFKYVKMPLYCEVVRCLCSFFISNSLAWHLKSSLVQLQPYSTVISFIYFTLLLSCTKFFDYPNSSPRFSILLFILFPLVGISFPLL